MTGQQNGLAQMARSWTSSLCIASAAIAVSAIGLSAPAFSEATISVYGGANFSPHSRVKTTDENGDQTSSNSVGWDGASFSMPPYYGVRATWWLEQMPEFGLAVDFTHAKVKADPLPGGFSTLEFTDGINFLTANALYRHDMGNRFTPYAGIGIGAAIPHVEVAGAGGVVGPKETMEYQITGIAGQIFVGVDYQVDDHWSVFGELKSNYGVVDADLSGGHNLETNIISNQVILGVTFKFQ